MIGQIADRASTTCADFEALLAAYRKNGYVVARNMISDAAIDLMKDDLARILSLDIFYEFNRRTVFRRQDDHIHYLERIDPITDISPEFMAVAESPKVTSFAAACMNSKSVHLLKDKIILKKPGQHGYPLHQDYSWWHQYAANSICTAVVPLDDVTKENGGIEFYSGLHDRVFLPEGEYRELTEEEESLLDGAESEVVEMSPGDVLFFHPLTPHCSGPNLSKGPRRLFYPTFTMNADSETYWGHYKEHWRRAEEGMSSHLRSVMTFW